MKILFTSVGRRVELIQAFKNAAKELNVNLTVVGADVTSTAPALHFCDERKIVCRIDDANYIPELLSYCENEKMDCLIPTIDTDLLLLSQNREKFKEVGTRVLVSSDEKIKICRDKNYTSEYFLSLGMKAPQSYNCIDKIEEKLKMGELNFPVFIKPKDGSSSIDAYKVNNLADLRMYASKIKEYIVQPFIDGEEYTVDIFCDYEGKPVFITPRVRLAVRAGEVLKTQIVQDDSIICEMEQLIKDFKPNGQITVQLIKEKVTNTNYYIEINPRFGGGAPLSIKAGADSAKATIMMLEGKKLIYEKKVARNGAIYCRFDQSICADEGC